MKIPVIAIFDVGKTNKKLFLFNERYELVLERSQQFAEIVDEDGFACENLSALTLWVFSVFSEVSSLRDYEVKALNFSGYGASLVHLDKAGKPVTPLYNYLKPYPKVLQKQFYGEYGGEALISKLTASPVLGSLNSGMQIYRLKYEQPKLFLKIKRSLHLPQYLSFLFSHQPVSDMTSIGCHTNLWDFEKNTYHEWVLTEKIVGKLAPIKPSSAVLRDNLLPAPIIGVGLHDSSAALIPYLACFQEPFVLISTGTWCISMNPFNKAPLTLEELGQDCLCYLTYEAQPVKASRLFAGHQHEEGIKDLSKHFVKPIDYYKTVSFNVDKINELIRAFDLWHYKDYETAYHALMMDIVHQQVRSTELVIHNIGIKRIFVDGGFSSNPIYMRLLALAFPEMKVYAASVAQATALGAGLAIHSEWNDNDIPNDLIDLKNYSIE